MKLWYRLQMIGTDLLFALASASFGIGTYATTASIYYGFRGIVLVGSVIQEIADALVTPVAAGFVFTAIVNNFPTIVANFLSRLGAPYPDDDTLGFLLYYIVQYYGHVYKVMVGLSGVCPQNVLLIDAKLADAWADLQNICQSESL